MSKDLYSIKQEIDSIREYIDSELCKKCEEMFDNLQKLEKLLKEYQSVEHT